MLIIIIITLIVVPMMQFGLTLARYEKISVARVARIEATKGALRIAVADPAELYLRQCPQAASVWTPTSGLELTAPLVSRSDVRTSCELLSTANADFGGRLANGFVVAGTVAPAGTNGDSYITPDSASVNTWYDSDYSALTPTKAKLWAPLLPVRPPQERTEVNGWQMADDSTCHVYFPGTYRSPITLNSGKVYFASGVYYFEQPITISGSVEVVVGEGTVSGCANDQAAVFDSVNPPSDYERTSLGATFVFGGNGRLIINASGAGVVQSVVFNQRYVDKDDVGNRSAHRVSIMSVNGAQVSPGTYGDLDVPNSLHVPLSSVAGKSPQTAQSQSYVPSAWIATSPAPNSDLISITYDAAARATLKVVGYVAVPQGRIGLHITSPNPWSRASFEGGVLVGSVDASPTATGLYGISLQTPVVQKTLLLTATTTSGSPQVTARLKVQVNANGKYEVNSWTLE